MLLLGNEAQLEAHFGLFGNSANFDIRSVHGLRQTYHGLENHFGRTRWNS
jgi:CobQ-like glutamine amidotransferase family enzyme